LIREKEKKLTTWKRKKKTKMYISAQWCPKKHNEKQIKYNQKNKFLK